MTKYHSVVQSSVIKLKAQAVDFTISGIHSYKSHRLSVIRNNIMQTRCRPPLLGITYNNMM